MAEEEDAPFLLPRGDWPLSSLSLLAFSLLFFLFPHVLSCLPRTEDVRPPRRFTLLLLLSPSRGDPEWVVERFRRSSSYRREIYT